MKNLWKKARARNNTRGQAAIEFIVVAVVLFFFLLFLMSTAFLLVVSDYVDYATFMAARTLKSGFSTPDKQRENAQIVFNQYTEKIQGLARNFRLEFIRTDPNDVMTEGVVASYDMDLFYLPPVFIGEGAPASTIKLTAESHLGRDPSFTECTQYFKNYGSTIGISDEAILEQMDDNGC